MSKSKLYLILSIILVILLMTISCEPGEEELDDRSLPIALYMDSTEDTVLLLTGYDYRPNVFGVFIEESQNTIKNSGVLVDTSYIVYSIDTVMEKMDRKDVNWYSSNSAIVEIEDGIATGINAGTASVWAGINDIVSDSLQIIVGAYNLAPELFIDPPPIQLVFQDSTFISGRTLVGQDVTVTIESDTVDIDDNGHFGDWIYLQEDENRISITAVNNYNGLSTTKTKMVIYYPFETSGIVGHWSGLTLTIPFNFDIYEAFGIYIMDGTMTVDVTMIGGPMIIQDIMIIGLIRPDGTIDAELSKEWGGFTLTGTLEGYFLNSGVAQGSYGLEITRNGWPPVSMTATWEAEQDQ